MNLKNPPSLFVDIGRHLRSCIRTESGMFIAGDVSGTNFFIDSMGTLLQTARGTSAPDVEQIAEIVPGIIITVEDGLGFSVHDIRNINKENHPITTQTFATHLGIIMYIER